MRTAFLAVSLLMVLCTGCVSVRNDKSIVPPPGLFADFSAPLTAITEPIPCKNLKVGTASKNLYVWTWPILPFISVSDCDATLETAMKEGGMKKVYFADYHQNSFFGLVTRFTVTAYGE